MIVVDTNVMSELMSVSPSAAVFAWAGAQAAARVHTTAITVAEIRYGVERLPDGKRRTLLQAIASDVFGAFVERILPFDDAAAREYGRLVAERERSGVRVGILDDQIAAICLVHEATLVTRNTKHFKGLGIELVDPWDAGA